MQEKLFQVTYRRRGEDRDQVANVYGYSVGDVLSGILGLGKPWPLPKDLVELTVAEEGVQAAS